MTLLPSDPGWWDQADQAGEPIGWVVDYDTESVKVRARYQKKAESWVALGTFDRCLGQPRLKSLTIFPDADHSPPRDGVSQVVASRCIRSLNEQVGAVLSAGLAAELGLRPDDDFRVVPRVGRRGRSDLYYAQIARTYVGALESPRPLETVAKTWGLSVAQARERVRAARQRDLLDRPGRGPAGGDLTEKALRILQGQAEETSP